MRDHTAGFSRLDVMVALRELGPGWRWRVVMHIILGGWIIAGKAPGHRAMGELVTPRGVKSADELVNILQGVVQRFRLRSGHLIEWRQG